MDIFAFTHVWARITVYIYQFHEFIKLITEEICQSMYLFWEKQPLGIVRLQNQFVFDQEVFDQNSLPFLAADLHQLLFQKK